MIKRGLEIAGQFLFPNNIYCLICGAMIDESRPYSLCDNCVRELHWINRGQQSDGSIQRVCAKCGKALPGTYHGEVCYDCMSHEHFFDKGFSCLTYGLHERELMMDLKYNGKSYIAEKMGEILFDRMKWELADFTEDGIAVDIVIPVPISSGRLRKRGYNQSELMAKYFVRRWNRELAKAGEAVKTRAPRYDAGTLVRTKNTKMLRSLDPAERALAMNGAFAVKSTRKEYLCNKKVLLIDDIYTTGSTVDACSKALRQAGVQRIYLLTLASGGNRKPDT